MSDTVEIKSQGTQGTPEPGAGMSQGHVLDLKLPIGWLLSAYGVLLTVYGLLTDKTGMYAISLGLNLNLAWGILMIVVGGGFLLAAFLKRGRKTG
jgi:hypothetical protein